MNWASARCRRTIAPLHHHEARAGDAAGGLEVEAGLRRRESRSARAGVSAKLRGWPQRRNSTLAVSSGPSGTSSQRQVRDAEEQVAQRGVGRRRPRPRAGRSRPSCRRPARAAARTRPRRRGPWRRRPRGSRRCARRARASAAAMRARRVSSSARISPDDRRQAAAGEGGVEGVRLLRGSGGCRAWAPPGDRPELCRIGPRGSNPETVCCRALAFAAGAAHIPATSHWR